MVRVAPNLSGVPCKIKSYQFSYGRKMTTLPNKQAQRLWANINISSRNNIGLTQIVRAPFH